MREMARTVRARTGIAPPPPPIALVGRAAERAAWRRALGRGDRLITLIGPAGIGKTSLLLAFLWEERDAAWQRHGGSVRFCDLADARTADDLCAMVLRVLDAAH